MVRHSAVNLFPEIPLVKSEYPLDSDIETILNLNSFFKHYARVSSPVSLTLYRASPRSIRY